jgi:hypothetical protein
MRKGGTLMRKGGTLMRKDGTLLRKDGTPVIKDGTLKRKDGTLMGMFKYSDKLQRQKCLTRDVNIVLRTTFYHTLRGTPV